MSRLSARIYGFQFILKMILCLTGDFNRCAFELKKNCIIIFILKDKWLP